MNLLELHGSFVITGGKTNDISAIQSKMETQLNAMKTRTFVSNNVITFSTVKFYVPVGSLKNRSDSLRVIREGRIKINKERNLLTINWLVKLDGLYFLALCCAIVAGIIVIASAEIFAAVCAGIVFFLAFVVTGTVLIRARMNDMINLSVYRNY